MALNDFTGQNIQDTYKKLVQTEGNLFADGTGSILQIITSDQTSSMTVATASFAISASHEITYELSSSYAEIADALTPGIDIDVRNITSSGDISASGDVYASNLILPPNGEIAPSENQGTIKFMTKPPGTTNNGETVTIGQDLIEFKASPAQASPLHSYLKLQPVDGGQSEITFNDGQNDIDFVIKGVNEKTFQLNAEHDMFASRNHFGIASGSKKWPTSDYTVNGTPDKQLMVNGLTHLTGSVEIIGPITTNITASGNISSSGNLMVSQITASGGARFGGNVGIGGAASSKTLKVTGTIQSTGEAFWSHFDNLSSNSRFRDDLSLFFGVNRVLGWRYNSTLDKLVLTSGSANHTLTLDGSGNISSSGDLTVSNINGTINGGNF